MKKSLYFLLASLFLWNCFLKKNSNGSDCNSVAGVSCETTSVSGTIVDEDENAVAEADIILLGEQSSENAKRSAETSKYRDTLATAKSDDDGRFEFTDLVAGDYLLKVLKDDSQGAVREFTLETDEPKDLGDIVIKINSIVIGSVDKSIVQQAKTAFAEINEIGQKTEINRNGDFVFHNVPVTNNYYTISIYVEGDRVETDIDNIQVSMEKSSVVVINTEGSKEVESAIFDAKIPLSDRVLSALDLLDGGKLRAVLSSKNQKTLKLEVRVEGGKAKELIAPVLIGGLEWHLKLEGEDSKGLVIFSGELDFNLKDKMPEELDIDFQRRTASLVIKQEMKDKLYEELTSTRKLTVSGHGIDSLVLTDDYEESGSFEVASLPLGRDMELVLELLDGNKTAHYHGAVTSDILGEGADTAKISLKRLKGALSLEGRFVDSNGDPLKDLKWDSALVKITGKYMETIRKDLEPDGDGKFSTVVTGIPSGESRIAELTGYTEGRDRFFLVRDTVTILVRDTTEWSNIEIKENADLTEGLIAYYPFNGNANDESGNGNNGTINGATLTADRFGNENSAYSFDGVNDFISSNPILPISNQHRSISVWFNTTSASGNNGWNVNTMTSWGAPSNNKLCAIGVYKSKLMFGAFGTAYDVHTGKVVNDGNWHHTFMIYDGSLLKIFLDGKEVASETRNINTTNSAFYIGKRAGQSNQFMNGLVDDVRIYSRALNEEEILQLYNEGGWRREETPEKKPTEFSIPDYAIDTGDTITPVLTWDPAAPENVSVELESLDADVVAIDGRRCWGKKPGSAMVVASVGGLAHKDTFNVKVKETSQQLITFTLADVEISVGDTAAPEFKWDPAAPENASIELESLDADLVAIDGRRFWGKKPGSAMVVASVGGLAHKDTFNVKVREADQQFNSVDIGDTSIQVGKSLSPKIIWNPASADSLAYQFTSLQPSIASVSGSSIVGKAAGTAEIEILVIAHDYRDTFQVVVSEPTPPSSPLDINFTDDFEQGIGTWSADNGVWNVGTPGSGPKKCFSGTQCAATELNGHYGGHTDSRFISPRIQLPSVSGIEEVHLRFMQWFSYSSHDKGQVQLSVWDFAASTWGEWEDVGTAIIHTSGWSLKDVNLTKYAGQLVRIAFFHVAVRNPDYRSSESTGWYIDNIQVNKKIPSFTGDFEAGWGDWGASRGVWQVGTPTAGPDSCFTGERCAGTNLSGNYGGHTDSRLISPTIQLPAITGFEEVHLRFMQWFSYSSHDKGQVQVSVWDPAASAWGSWEDAGTEVIHTSGWSLKDVNLTKYAGQVVRVAFFHIAIRNPDYRSSESTGWYIDDVGILEMK